MKVYIGPYKNWFGPYQLAELLCFWAKETPGEYGIMSKPEFVHNLGTWLSGGDDNTSWLCKFLTWVDSKRKRRVKIRIDRYDTWNMDGTLASIILPMLKQLKATKHGSQIVDLEDVPEHLRCNTTEDWDDQKCFDFYNEHEVKEGDCDIHARWDWVLNEMIWTFEQLDPDNDWEDQYYSGESDYQFEKEDNDSVVSRMIHGPKHTLQVDFKGMEEHNKRISNGLVLFGKYYRGLWD